VTDRGRVQAALAGHPVDRFPVAALYSFLYYDDHFAELTGLPAWRWHQWLAGSPDDYAVLYAQMHAAAPFELLLPHVAPPRAWRERQEFVEREGTPFRHDRLTDEWVPLDTPSHSGHATDYRANETQIVFDRANVDARVTVVGAEQEIAGGANDYLEAIVARFGAEQFIVSGGVIGTLFSCHGYTGLTNLFAMLAEAPDLVDYLSARLLEVNLQAIRRLAAAGGDAIYIDDAMATSDMISVAHYERFCVPYMAAMVAAIHRLGHQAILIYFGGVMDRLEQIAALGADALLVEASMKGYVNDIGEIAARIGDRVTLFGNLDPVGVLQEGSDAAVEAEVRRQVAAGRRARGFIVSPASPITPATPLARVQRFLALARDLGRC
jgi:hypothetical protein